MSRSVVNLSFVVAIATAPVFTWAAQPGSDSPYNDVEICRILLVGVDDESIGKAARDVASKTNIATSDPRSSDAVQSDFLKYLQTLRSHIQPPSDKTLSDFAVEEYNRQVLRAALTKLPKKGFWAKLNIFKAKPPLLAADQLPELLFIPKELDQPKFYSQLGYQLTLLERSAWGGPTLDYVRLARSISDRFQLAAFILGAQSGADNLKYYDLALDVHNQIHLEAFVMGAEHGADNLEYYRFALRVSTPRQILRLRQELESGTDNLPWLEEMVFGQ